MTPYCPIDRISMAKVPKRKRTWKCPKCDLKMTKPWKREKKYGHTGFWSVLTPEIGVNPAWNSQINQELKEAKKI